MLRRNIEIQIVSDRESKEKVIERREIYRYI